MTWQSINDTFKQKYDRHVVFCEDPNERTYIIGLVREHLPEFSRATVAAAVDSCCQQIPAPRPRDWFFDCLKDVLAKYHEA